jgi:hypothetical protein
MAADVVAGEEAQCRASLAELIRQYPIERGNWEVDCAEAVEPVLDMAAGRAPMSGRFAAVAADCTYTFIAVTDSEEQALARLVAWVRDEQYPKRPLVLADLASGVVHNVKVLAVRAATVTHLWEGGREHVPVLV